jgi:hypothetical protein
VPENKVVSLEERAKDEQKPFLEQLLREGARKLLQAAIENEVIDRLRTLRTKGRGSRIATLTMVFKLGLEAQKHWRRLQGFELIPKVVTRVRFVDGEEQTNRPLNQTFQQGCARLRYTTFDNISGALIQSFTDRQRTLSKQIGLFLYFHTISSLFLV